jgi:hypothetical protein
VKLVNKRLFFTISALKVIGTFFALLIYGSIVKLGDSQGYASNNKEFSYNILLNRTEFTEFLFSSITVVTNSVFITHLISSLFVGYCIYYVFKDSYRFINKHILFLTLSLPHFLIWTGVTTKELLSVALFSIFIKQVFNIVDKSTVNKKILIFAGVVAVFLRPHYGIAYLYLFVSTVLITYIYRRDYNIFSKGVVFLFYGFLILVLVTFLYYTFEYWEDVLIAVMEKSKNYFIHYSGSSTRYDLEFKSVSDFFSMIPSGLFMSLVGPTFAESLSRPLFFVAFIEGVIYLGICLFIYYVFFIKSLAYRNNLFLSLFLFSFLPALIALLLAHYPLGVFNPGTALRYKQALVPLMVFFPLLMLGLFRKNKSEKYS